MKKIILFVIIGLFSLNTRQIKAQDSFSGEEAAQLIIRENEKINDLTVNFSQVNKLRDMQMQVSGKMLYKKPGKLNVQAKIQAMDGGYNMNDLLVLNDGILWQVKSTPAGKIAEAVKARLEASSAFGDNLLRQFVPQAQFKKLVEEYEINGVKEPQPGVILLEMQLKEDVKNKMLRMMEASGISEAGEMIPERLFYSWDKNTRCCLKIEGSNRKNELIYRMEYSLAVVNSGIKDEVFSYNPPAGVKVLDMTKLEQSSDDKGNKSSSPAKDAMQEQPCPDFSLFDLNEQQYASEKMKGKIIIINFWATWCPPCQKELPLLEQLYQEIKNEKQLQFLTVCNEAREKVTAFIEEKAYTFPVLIDENNALAEKFRVESIPRIFVVAKDGKIAAVYTGYHQDIADSLRADIEKLK